MDYVEPFAGGETMFFFRENFQPQVGKNLYNLILYSIKLN